VGCISGGGVLVSLCWDRGYGGCKRGFRGIVNVARLFVVKATRATVFFILTGNFGLSQSLKTNTRINVFAIGHSAFCQSLPYSFLLKLRYLTTLLNADVTWCR
jgi:hypothetical protein